MLAFETRLGITGLKLFSMLYDSIVARIVDFNMIRGRRKGLQPDIVDVVPYPRKKFGIILDYEDWPADRIVASLADKTIKCMLARKPRPQKIAFDIFDGAASLSPYLGAGKLRFRLTIHSPRVARRKSLMNGGSPIDKEDREP